MRICVEKEVRGPRSDQENHDEGNQRPAALLLSTRPRGHWRACGGTGRRLNGLEVRPGRCCRARKLGFCRRRRRKARCRGYSLGARCKRRWHNRFFEPCLGSRFFDSGGNDVLVFALRRRVLNLRKARAPTRGVGLKRRWLSHQRSAGQAAVGLALADALAEGDVLGVAEADAELLSEGEAEALGEAFVWPSWPLPFVNSIAAGKG